MNRQTRVCPRMLNYKPPRVAMCLLLAATVMQLATPAVWPSLPVSVTGGAIIAALGFSIMLRAWWLFRQRQTAICPTAATSTLITEDIYRLTRNPMYLGIVLMLLGVALGTGGLSYYVATFLFFLIIDFVFCPYEEQKLAQSFSLEYRRYANTVRRWL